MAAVLLGCSPACCPHSGYYETAGPPQHRPRESRRRLWVLTTATGVLLLGAAGSPWPSALWGPSPAVRAPSRRLAVRAASRWDDEDASDLKSFMADVQVPRGVANPTPSIPKLKDYLRKKPLAREAKQWNPTGAEDTGGADGWDTADGWEGEAGWGAEGAGAPRAAVRRRRRAAVTTDPDPEVGPEYDPDPASTAGELVLSEHDALVEAILKDDWAPPQRFKGTIPYFVPPKRTPFVSILRRQDTVIPLLRLDDVAPDRVNLTGRLPAPPIMKPIAVLRVRANNKVSAGQYRPTTNHMAREVTDPRLRAYAEDCIRNLTVFFFADLNSPFRRMAGPTMKRWKHDEYYVEHVAPIVFPPHWPGVDLLPSPHALAFFHRGMPIGAAVVVDRFVDLGPTVTIAVFFKTEHDSIRSMMLGQKKRNYKMLRTFLTNQMSLVLGIPTTIHLGVVPVDDWSRVVGGLRFLTGEHAP